jgi:hypothetical protein
MNVELLNEAGDVICRAMLLRAGDNASKVRHNGRVFEIENARVRAIPKLDAGARATLVAKCERLVRKWHEAERVEFLEATPASKFPGGAAYYDAAYAKKVIPRRDYVALNIGGSGAFMVRMSDGIVFNIEAYGRPKNQVGQIDTIAVETLTGRRWN